MLLIIEGCDGAGKTTFAEAMASRAEAQGYDAEIWHSGPPEQHPLVEYELNLETLYDPTENKLIIADRWHLGELIYGPLYRPETSAREFSRGAAWHVSAKLNALGAVQIVMNPSLYTIRKRLADRGEDFLKPEHVEHVHESYSSFGYSDTSLGRFITYIGGDVMDAQRVQRTMSLLELRRWQGLALRRFTSYVGSHLPSILLLTGHRDETPQSDSHAAAMVPYPGTDARWLCDAIDATSGALAYDTHNIGIANANVEDVRELWSSLSEPMVVTLDEDAGYLATKALVPHGSVPSVAFARRFRTDPAHYITSINTAAATNRKVDL